MSDKQSESVPVDAILEHAEGFAMRLPGEDNASHLSRLVKLAGPMPVYSDQQTDSRFAERLGLYFAIYKMLDSYLRATLPSDVLDI
jgi:hypothetical protein